MDSRTGLVCPIIQTLHIHGAAQPSFFSLTTFSSGTSSKSTLQHICESQQTEARQFAQNEADRHTEGLKQELPLPTETLLRLLLLTQDAGLQKKKKKREPQENKRT